MRAVVLTVLAVTLAVLAALEVEAWIVGARYRRKAARLRAAGMRFRPLEWDDLKGAL